MSFDLPITEAVLNYLVPGTSKPVRYTYSPPPEGAAAQAGRPDPRRVPIHDARKLAEPASLDVEGFALVDHKTNVWSFYDDIEVRTVYYREVETLLRRETGADKVVIFDHTLRSSSAAPRGTYGVREPVRSVHNDYTVWSGRRRVSDHLDADEASERLKGRHAVINVWRSIRPVIETSPLAVCDARTIRPDDWLPTDLVYPDRVGEVYSVRYNPAHRWYTYDRMRREEALLIKTYDSAEDGTARFSAHTSFDDPTSSPGAAPRESIEVRALVLYPRCVGP
jgi:hypothetical protein